VHVYTSGDEAELFLNGQSLGRKHKEKYQYRLRWDDVVYQPGELKVVAYKNGRKWAEDSVATTGAAALIAMTPDRQSIVADGRDLSFVTVRLTDDAHRPVPRAHNRVRFSIDGPGEIVATDNGDPTCLEVFANKERDAFNGMALVIVRGSPGQAGPITLRAESDGLPAASVQIESR
jgi:beta-galactosidase